MRFVGESLYTQIGRERSLFSLAHIFIFGRCVVELSFQGNHTWNTIAESGNLYSDVEVIISRALANVRFII